VEVVAGVPGALQGLGALGQLELQLLGASSIRSHSISNRSLFKLEVLRVPTAARLLASWRNAGQFPSDTLR